MDVRDALEKANKNHRRAGRLHTMGHEVLLEKALREATGGYMSGSEKANKYHQGAKDPL